MYVVKLKERKTSKELKRTVGIEISQYDDQKCRLRWFDTLNTKMIPTGSSIV